MSVFWGGIIPILMRGGVWGRFARKKGDTFRTKGDAFLKEGWGGRLKGCYIFEWGDGA